MQPARLRLTPESLVLAAALSATATLAMPYDSNQNQYFASYVGSRVPALANDWLVSTGDPYPVFTQLVSPIVDSTGTAGLRVLALALTFVALLGIYLLAQVVSRARSRAIPALTMCLLAVPLAPWWPWPGVQPLTGVATQYLVSKPAMVQPSSAGVLLLPAIALWLSTRAPAAEGARWRGLVALGLAAFTCAVHPTYLVVVIIGFVLATVADLASGTRPRLAYAWGGLGIAALTVALNPSLLLLGRAAGESSQALQRFAFERIPWHTLWNQWPVSDVWLVAVVVVGAFLAVPLRNGRWLRTWLLGVVLVGAVSAAVVFVWRPTGVALLFAWRISAVAVPLAAVIAGVRVLEFLRRRVPFRVRGYWPWAAGVVALALAYQGIVATIAVPATASSDRFTALVLQAKPRGVGLVPLSAENVRLNAGVAIYVDSKSPPYAGDDLAQWWVRIDQVRALRADPGGFCTAAWAPAIDWILTDRSLPQPSCTRDWTLLAARDGMTVVQRPGVR